MKQNAVRSFAVGSDGTDDRTVAEWVIRAPEGKSFDVEVTHDRAGVAQTTVTLA